MRTPHTTIDVPSEDITSMPPAVVAVGRGLSRQFKVPRDMVVKGTTILEDEPRDLILWLHDHCCQKDVSKDELSRLLKKPNGTGYYSENSVLQLLRGDRVRKGEPIDQMLDAIRPLRDLEMRRAEMVTSGFIETRLFKEIERRAERARLRRKICYVFGNSHIGKTTNLREYQRRHNHGHTIYVDMPTGGSLGKFVKALARAFNITEKSHSLDRIQERIKESMDPGILIVIDNAHRCLNARYKEGGLMTMSFIQEIYDHIGGCGMLISMTNEGRDEMIKGSNSKRLEQMWRRRILPLQLPDVAPADDLELFARAYGLSPAPDMDVPIKVAIRDENGQPQVKTHKDNPLRLQESVNKSDGLGVWVAILQDASDMSAEKNKPITWGAVIKAYTLAQAEAEILN